MDRGTDKPTLLRRVTVSVSLTVTGERKAGGKLTPAVLPSPVRDWRARKEKSMIEFFVPMQLPTVTAQEQKTGVRNGKPYRYDTPELKAARVLFRDHLAKYAPQIPITGAVKLHTIWCYHSETHGHGEWKTTKPDTDNSVKLLKDVMTKLGFWKDDAQVSSELTEKVWADIPGLYVSVEALA